MPPPADPLPISTQFVCRRSVLRKKVTVPKVGEVRKVNQPGRSCIIESRIRSLTKKRTGAEVLEKPALSVTTAVILAMPAGRGAAGKSKGAEYTVATDRLML